MRLASLAMGGAVEGAVLLEDGSARLLGKSVAETIAEAAAGATLGDLSDLPQVAPAAVALVAPIPVPAKNVFCVGRNYMEHIAEGERAQNTKVGVTEVPVFFTKPPTAVTGPGAAVPLFPSVSSKVDYEVELAVIIGKAGRNIAPQDAFDHIFGYTIVNDITARDVQRRHGGQYFKGKGLDGSCPMGPWIVTKDEIADPHALAIRCSVNGELRQNGTTRDMIFDIPTLIASLSEGLTLQPGDVLATGTPSGVGYAMEPPCFLADGDTVTCEVEGIGTLTNVMATAEGASRQVA